MVILILLLQTVNKIKQREENNSRECQPQSAIEVSGTQSFVKLNQNILAKICRLDYPRNTHLKILSETECKF